MLRHAEFVFWAACAPRHVFFAILRLKRRHRVILRFQISVTFEVLQRALPAATNNRTYDATRLAVKGRLQCQSPKYALASMKEFAKGWPESRHQKHPDGNPRCSNLKPHILIQKHETECQSEMSLGSRGTIHVGSAWSRDLPLGDDWRPELVAFAAELRRLG